MPVVSMDFLTHRSHRMDFDSVLAQDFLVRPNGADERYRQLADFFLPEPALAARDFRARPERLRQRGDGAGAEAVEGASASDALTAADSHRRGAMFDPLAIARALTASDIDSEQADAIEDAP